MLTLTGHPRSGTELLFRLCNAHPDVELTLESGVFRSLGVPSNLYRLSIAGRAWARRSDPVLLEESSRSQRANRWTSHLFMARLANDVARHQRGLVSADDVAAALWRHWPNTRYVGDKFPDYVFNLGAITSAPSMRTIVIYRDVRDVVASYLNRLDNGWNRVPIFNDFTTPAAIASRWVTAMNEAARFKERIWLVSYESLVYDTPLELAGIARYLDIDPKGFTYDPVHTNSVGIFRERLTSAQIAEVERQAQDAMKVWGY